jgi:signal transduction histidine kinase
MTLRSRISLAFLTITVILVAPAVYSLYVLTTLRDITENLRTRDAQGALALGQLQTVFGQLTSAQRDYYLLAGEPRGRSAAREQVDVHRAEFEIYLHRLAEAQYEEETRLIRARWQRAQLAIERERQLIETDRVAAAEEHRTLTVEPTFDAVNLTFQRMADAIDEGVGEHAARARELAGGAVQGTLLALAVALSLAVLIAGWLTRSVLRPIHELRQGMSVVAGGNFEPEVRVDPNRPDELGDLARSFDRMSRQLAELDRLQAEFVSVASHELKTPLSVIKGYVSLLLEGIYGDVPEKQRKVLGSVSDQADRLGRLIQQLLDISRFEAGGGRLEVRPIDVRAFLMELTTSFEALAVQNDIDFRMEAGEDLPDTLVGDPDRLNEVVGNLLSNAFKFTPREGTIRLRAGSAGKGVVMEVQDTGVGIPREHLERIFEKFYQVDNEAQPKSIGSGLGLAISREIVEAHGGTITAESEVGRGTTFRVFLPQNGASA